MSLWLDIILAIFPTVISLIGFGIYMRVELTKHSERIKHHNIRLERLENNKFEEVAAQLESHIGILNKSFDEMKLDIKEIRKQQNEVLIKFASK